MAAINLLPWRQRRRQRRLRLGLVGVASAAALALLGVGLAALRAEQVQDRAQARQAMLQARLQHMRATGGGRRYAALLAQDQQIARWLARRNALPVLLRQWAGTVPAGVALVSVELHGDELVLQGRATAQQPIEGYLRNLRGAPWLGTPEMAALQAAAGRDDGSLPEAFTVKAVLRASWLRNTAGTDR